MTISRETLMAFVDGELLPDEARRVAAEVAGDPALNAYVEQQKQLAGQLHAAFAPVLKQQIPERLERAIWETKVAVETNFASSLIARLSRIWHEQTSRAGRSWIPAGAMATGIALGVLLAGSFGIGTLMRSDGDALIAQGQLAQTLTTALASDQQDLRGGAARIGVSFWSKDGAFCRSFTTQGNRRGSLAGIACRENGDWRITTLAAAEAHDSSTFATAGADMPAIVRGAMSSMISGDPLDAEQERAARNQGWRAK
jgi:anti-sigma factor RsiW